MTTEPDANAARRKLEALVQTMDPVIERLDRVMLRHRKVAPAGAKRKQPEPPSSRPLSFLLGIDKRQAEIRVEFNRIYEEAMAELDKVEAWMKADDAELQDMKGSHAMEVETFQQFQPAVLRVRIF
jgi:exonuclease VII small subunit